MNCRTCIKFLFFWLSLFAIGFAEPTLVPFDESKDKILDEYPHHSAPLPQTSFLDLFWVLLKTLLIIGGFIGFFYLATLLFRRLMDQRFDNRDEGEDIKILERAILSNKSAIYLLEVKNKYFLIGESHNGLSHLGEVNPTDS